jgi:FkbM family methyltransferase
LAQILDRGHVLAVEANPENVSRLESNIRINKIDDVDVVAKAIDDEWDEVDLAVEENVAGEDDHSPVTREDRPTISIRVAQGDNIVGDYLAPPVIKIDVEAFEGLMKTISNPECRFVFCEIHYHPGSTPVTLGGYLKKSDSRLKSGLTKDSDLKS